ncbi:MAG: hypothetical protein HQL67_02130 [Magnetococcales bacterium]|nr:hypothetical protein [Magnetococcales bacterium]
MAISHSFFQRSLSRKVLFVSCFIGGVALLILGLFLTQALRSELIKQNNDLINNLASSARQGLHAIMLTGNAEIAREYARHLKMVEGVKQINIIKTNGQEAFLLSNEQRSPLLAEDLPYFRSALESKKSVSFIRSDDLDRLTKTFFIPIPIEEPCKKCHQDGKAIRGIFEVTVSLDAIETQVGRTVINAIWVTIASLVLFLIVLGVTLRRILTLPLTDLSHSVQQVAKGKLTSITFDTQRKDEFGLISTVLQQLVTGLGEQIRKINLQSENMVGFIKEIIRLRNDIGTNAVVLKNTTSDVSLENLHLAEEIAKIKSRVDQATDNVANISEGTVIVSNSSQEISHSLLQTNNRVNEMIELVGQMEQILNHVRETLGNANQETTHVSTAIQKMALSLGEVRQQCQKASVESNSGKNMAQEAIVLTGELITASHEINQVTTIIAEVASETQMLGLNALIEAASAGEAGKGFAVVAYEIKELSNRTMEATIKIDSVLQKIQAQSGQVSHAVKNIGKTIDNLDDSNQWIRQAMETQESVIQTISQSTHGLTRTTQSVNDNTASLDRAAKALFEAVEAVQGETRTINDEAGQAAESAAKIATQSAESKVFLQTVQQSAQETHDSSLVVQEKMALTNDVVNTVQSSVHFFKALSEVAAYMSDALLSVNLNIDIGPAPFNIRLLKEPFLGVMGELEAMVSQVKPVDTDLLNDACPLCRWIHQQQATYSDQPIFNNLIATHDQLHTTTDEIMKLVEKGLTDPEARLALRFFQEVRSTLFDQLNALYMGESQLNRNDQLMDWQEEFSHDNPEIDADHQQLIRQLNDLYSQQKAEQTRTLLKTFMATAHNHFVREKHISSQKQSPLSEEAQLHNQELINHLEQILFLHEEEDFIPSQDLFLYLRGWLKKHITGRDSGFLLE